MAVGGLCQPNDLGIALHFDLFSFVPNPGQAVQVGFTETIRLRYSVPQDKEAV